MLNQNNPNYGPRRSNPDQANAARVQQVALGGDQATYAYRADREAYAEVIKHHPVAGLLAVNNQAWQERAVRYLAQERKIKQFLDLGSGIPGGGLPGVKHVHEIAQRIDPSSRVVYVDYESYPVHIARDLLEKNDNATAIHADLRQPDAILRHEEVQSLLDPNEPIALLFISMAHFIDDEDNPFELFEYYKKQLLKPGDWVALTHLTWEYVARRADEQEVERGRDAYNKNVTENLTIRDIDQIMDFFRGTRLVEPGLVPVTEWKPDDPAHTVNRADMGQTTLVGGIGQVV